MLHLISLLPKRMRPILQSDNNDCGAACLSMISQYFRVYHTLAELKNIIPPDRDGLDAKSLSYAAHEIGLSSQTVHVGMARIRELPKPCILHWNLDHYVVLEKIQRNFAQIIDPALGRLQIPLSELSDHFTGVALTFEYAQAIPSKHHKLATLNIWDIISSVKNIALPLILIVFLGLVVGGIGFVSPLISQFAINTATTHNNVQMVIGLLLYQLFYLWSLF